MLNRINTRILLKYYTTMNNYCSNMQQNGRNSHRLLDERNKYKYVLYDSIYMESKTEQN